MLRRGEHHIRNGYGLMQPTAKSDGVALFDEAWIFDRNEIVNHDRELYSVASLCRGDMLHVAGNAPGGAE
jgi:hypothetical protein